MRWRTWSVCGALIGAALVGCDSPPPATVDGGRDAGRDAAMGDGGPDEDDAGPPDGGPGDAGMPDGGPPDTGMPDGGIFTDEEWAIIATLGPLPELPPDTTNAVADDPEAAALGHALWFDARYSGPLAVESDLGAVGDTGRVSCASCHGTEVMSDDVNVSVGANFHTRNSPAVVNSAYSTWTNWGGRFSAQWELPPIVAENPGIMNSSRLAVAHHIFDHYRTEYEAIFGPMDEGLSDLTRFPATARPAPAGGPPGPWEMMTAADRTIVLEIFTNYGKVIQAYMRQLISRDSDFDRFVAGEGTLTESEINGLRLFVGRAGCVSCHSGPTFSDQAFHNIGVPLVGAHVPSSDDGRFRDLPGLLNSPLNSAGMWSDDPDEGMRRLMGLSLPPPEEMRGQFRTPTLRGVALSAPYMSSGQHATLAEVIAFYVAGGATPVSGTLDPAIEALDLTEAEQADLEAFLATLNPDPVPIELRSPPVP